MTMFIVWFAVLGVTGAYKCMDPPEMHWPDKVRICDGEFGNSPGCNDDYTIPYNQQCPIDGGDLGKTLGRCEKVCDGNYVNVTAVNVQMVDEKTQNFRWSKCYVIRPWEQKVYYMKCKSDRPTFESSSFKCVPDNFIRRRVAVFCPEFKEHQCQKVDLELPTNCAASRFECVQPKKTKQQSVDSFFDSLFL
ncbi:unnamed protein product [Mytilus edulis]|uniref:Uncharacterized protein n=1 Tax=Mytilus edulis TaxID=6550 RepID=A0A8S3SF40_MYTED|nr:unnamed protein product [Mytilus edulis]